MVSEVTIASFDQKALNNKKPSVVKVYTERCPNCRTIQPIFEEVAKENKDTFNFFALNAHDNMEIAKRYKVLSVPTLLFFSHGILVDKKTGVISQKKIKKRLILIEKYSIDIAKEKEVTGFFKLPWK